MSVTIDPSTIDSAQVVLAISDAPDNDSAIREIDRWAREHGFTRSREYFLNARRAKDGNTVRYSACYRLTEEDRRTAVEDMAAIRERRKQMPLTTSSDVLLRES